MNESMDVVFTTIVFSFLLVLTVIKKYGHEIDRSFDCATHRTHKNKLEKASARGRDKFMIERGIFKCIIYGALCVRFNFIYEVIDFAAFLLSC